MLGAKFQRYGTVPQEPEEEQPQAVLVLGDDVAPRSRAAWGGLMLLCVAAVAAVGLSGGGAVRTAEVQMPMVVQAALQQHGAKGWEFVGKADPSERIKLHLMMKMSNLEELMELAMAVSDPDHIEYGNHRSMDELAELTRPPAENVALVERWLIDNGVPSSAFNHTRSGDIVTVTLPVSQAEQMLDAEYGMYQLPGRKGKPVIRAKSYSLPENVGNVIDWVGPTVEFPMVRSIAAVGHKVTAAEHAKHVMEAAEHKAKKAAKQEEAEAEAADLQVRRLNEEIASAAGFKTEAQKVSAAPGGLVDPPNLKAWYDMPTSWKATQKDNKQAVVGFLDEHTATSKDMIAFLKKYAKEEMRAGLQGPRVMVESQGGGYAGIESTLDLEYIMGMGIGIPTEFYYYDGRAKNADGDAENEPFLEWLEQVGGMHDKEIPGVFSISYADWEASVPRQYAESVNRALAKLAARGVTVLAASGDGGVEGAGPLPHSAWKHSCKKGDDLYATFPASSPWVTSVGAVSGFAPEKGAALSAGGFSKYFDQPVYQKHAVPTYLAHCDPSQYDDLPDSQRERMVKTMKAKCRAGSTSNPPLPDPKTFNKQGRAIPDISMQGRNFIVMFGGSWTHVDGTSASTPTVAAMIAAINDHRVAEGHSRVGFLNPAIYNAKVTGAFNDVIYGSNPGCGIDGFHASRGWDPVTGLGTPNFNRLKTAMMSVSGKARARRASEKAAAGKNNLREREQRRHH